MPQLADQLLVEPHSINVVSRCLLVHVSSFSGDDRVRTCLRLPGVHTFPCSSFVADLGCGCCPTAPTLPNMSYVTMVCVTRSISVMETDLPREKR